MRIQDYIDKNNLHHAYLIEGAQDEIMPQIFKFMESMGIKTLGNPDFCYISLDAFKIEDARNLKSVEYEKGFSAGKKIFVISANNFLLEAQNTLLKIFEEPVGNTHFFIIVPDKNILLKTLLSRFYLISVKPLFRQGLKSEGNVAHVLKEAEKFIAMPLKHRIDFIKNLLAERKEDEQETTSLNSNRSKALKFLNMLEFVLHNKPMSRLNLDIFEHIFKVREFINQPGSSVKNLMESVALVVPNFN